MNQNIWALSTLLKRRASVVNKSWKIAKSHCRLDSDKKNYVRAFKTLLILMKWGGNIDAIPEKIGQSFIFMGTPSLLVGYDEFSFTIEASKQTLKLPLINLIFCNDNS